jgi:hypothetical protein
MIPVTGTGEEPATGLSTAVMELPYAVLVPNWNFAAVLIPFGCATPWKIAESASTALGGSVVAVGPEAVVKVRTSDQALVPEELFAFTRQK